MSRAELSVLRVGPNSQSPYSSAMSLSNINWGKFFTILVVDEESTKIKEISPMVQEQEEQHFPDGIDGPSKSTDAAVSSAIELIIGHFKL